MGEQPKQQSQVGRHWRLTHCVIQLLELRLTVTGPVRVLPPASVNIIKQPDSALKSAFLRCPGIVYNHMNECLKWLYFQDTCLQSTIQNYENVSICKWDISLAFIDTTEQCIVSNTNEMENIGITNPVSVCLRRCLDKVILLLVGFYSTFGFISIFN